MGFPEFGFEDLTGAANRQVIDENDSVGDLPFGDFALESSDQFGLCDRAIPDRDQNRALAPFRVRSRNRRSVCHRRVMNATTLKMLSSLFLVLVRLLASA